MFYNGYTSNWVTELLKIVKVKITTPIPYVLEKLIGDPIQDHFIRMRFRITNAYVYFVERISQRKGRKIKLRWLGFNIPLDSWTDVINKL